MSWIFGTIDFDAYGVMVSRSAGVMNLPKLQTEGHNWKDVDGLEYWQDEPKYNDREIVLNCWMMAKKDETNSGYQNFRTKVQSFTDAVKAAGKVTFQTPYINIPDCSISKGISVIRETNYVQDIQAGTFILRITVHGDADFMQLDIKRWTGTETLTVASVFTNNLKVPKTLQGDIYASCSFKSNTKLDLKYFDYFRINSNGVNEDTFHLPANPNFKKGSSNEFIYDLRFEHQSEWLKNSQFLNDRLEADFYYYANMEEIVDWIVTNHNRSWWNNFQKGTVATTERRNHKFSAEDCLSVLKRIAKDYGLEYEFEYVAVSRYNINIKQQVANTKAVTLQYGQGNGLYELSREPVDKSELCTILYAYGADKNLKPDYRNGIGRLSFDNNPLKNNEGLHDGAGPHEKTVYFDDIFPNRTATVTAYEQVLPLNLTNAQKEVWPDGIYKPADSSLDFDINSYLLGGLTAKMRMKTGDLAGFEFEIAVYDHTYKSMWIIPFKDERGDVYPNATMQIAVGDEYTLVDIGQPPTYIAAAEAALEAKAQGYINEHSIPKFPYRCIINPAFMAANPGGFEVGNKITVIDADYGINGLFRISNLTYDAYKLTYELTLSDTARLSRNQQTEIRLKSVEVALEDTGKDQVEQMRKDQETTGELRNRLLDPNNDKLKTDKIVRNESIDPRMLAYDAGTLQWSFRGVWFYDKNEDGAELAWTAGNFLIHNWADNTLDRYTIDKRRTLLVEYNPTRTWN
uniref:hypothetical protein n=1 Tax=Mariniphaga sediminis TaxID=1628158 RepID=UPI003562F9A2